MHFTCSNTGKPLFSGAFNAIGLALKNAAVFLSVLLLLAVILSGCGMLDDSLPGEKPTSSSNSSDSGDDEKPKAGAKLIMPPGMDGRPLKPGQSESATLPNGLPALQPLKGVKVDELFTRKITDTDERFDRLENAVLDMRREFEAVKPAIVRLVAVEEDIQKLVEQLETMAKGEPVASAPVPAVTASALDQAPPPAQAPPPEPAPVALTQPAEGDPASLPPVPPRAMPPPSPPPAQAANIQPLTPEAPAAPAVLASAPPAQQPAPAPVQTAQPPATPATSKTAVKEIRFGVHSGYTRIVLDLGAQTPHSVDIDNQEKVVVITLPEAGWNAPASGSPGGDIVKSYSAQPGPNGGTNLALVIGKAVRVASSGIIPAGANPNTRLFIDLAPQ